MKKSLHCFGLIVVISLFMGCTKKKIEQPVVIDYRETYIGNYNFQIIQFNWMMGQPPKYDTTYYQGNIRTFQHSDIDIDMSSFENDSEVDAKRITIHFNNSLYITPEINTTGVFTEKNGYHYGQSGKFTSKDSVDFYIGGLGGLGGGTSYTVHGHRL